MDGLLSRLSEERPEEHMQCQYCKEQELEVLSSEYFVCKKCGKLNYTSLTSGKKPGPGSEVYFAIGVIAAGMIITLLVLLFVTASMNREKQRSATGSKASVTEIKPVPGTGKK